MSKKRLCFNCNYRTLLLIDDDTASYILISKLLASHNFKVVRAKCGVSALDMFMKNPCIVLVLMEINLPNLNGFDLKEQIREITPHIPIIIQTTDNQYENIQKCIRSGFNDYILKPIDLDLFVDTLIKHLKLSINNNLQGDIRSHKHCFFDKIF